jgi:hypothetical protein
VKVAIGETQSCPTVRLTGVDAFAGTCAHRRRCTAMMDKNTGRLGLIVGCIVALGAAIFILSGGDLGGKTTVASDRDLPPVASER